MSTIKLLVDKNKEAFKHHFYTESLTLSYILIIKALRQIAVDSKLLNSARREKLNGYLKLLNKEYDVNPLFNKKIKKSVVNQIVEFSANYKQVMKEIKFQYPEIKLKNTAKQGIQCVILLNTTLIKLKSNKI